VFILGNLLNATAGVLDVVLSALLIVIVVNALLSWVRPDPYNPIVQFLDRISDIVCAPIRRLIPTTVGSIDLAPLIACLLIFFTRLFVVETLRDLAVRMS
jgi:YggT family protein